MDPPATVPDFGFQVEVATDMREKCREYEILLEVHLERWGQLRVRYFWGAFLPIAIIAATQSIISMGVPHDTFPRKDVLISCLAMITGLLSAMAGYCQWDGTAEKHYAAAKTLTKHMPPIRDWLERHISDVKNGYLKSKDHMDEARDGFSRACEKVDDMLRENEAPMISRKARNDKQMKLESMNSQRIAPLPQANNSAAPPSQNDLQAIVPYPQAPPSPVAPGAEPTFAPAALNVPGDAPLEAASMGRPANEEQVGSSAVQVKPSSGKRPDEGFGPERFPA